MRPALRVAAVCATPLAAQKAKPATDSATVHALAVKQSPKPDSAHVAQLVIWSETADVTMYMRRVAQRLRFVRQKGEWKRVPTPPGMEGR